MALVGVLLVAATVASVPADAIYRGHNVAFHRYEFMVSLRLASTPDSPRCSGTLIAPDIVLTAGHCVAGVPLLVPDRGGFRQVGVTSLGSDSTDKLYAGFTSVPVAAEMDRRGDRVVAERHWRTATGRTVTPRPG